MLQLIIMIMITIIIIIIIMIMIMIIITVGRAPALPLGDARPPPLPGDRRHQGPSSNQCDIA